MEVKQSIRYALIFILATSLLLAGEHASAQRYDPEESPVWQQLKKTVFAQRAINASPNNTIRLDISGRAEDASIVLLGEAFIARCANTVFLSCCHTRLSSGS